MNRLGPLEFEKENAVWRRWRRELSREHLLVRDDERGCGHSDRNAVEQSHTVWGEDLEAVADAAGRETFAPIGDPFGAGACPPSTADSAMTTVLQGDWTACRVRENESLSLPATDASPA